MPSVLLIDDDPVEGKLVDAFLRRRYRDGYELVHAYGLDEAIAALRERRFDHILLDSRLPPFADYRETLPVLMLHAGGTDPIVISACLRGDCFAESRRYGARQVLDKMALKDRIGDGLFG